MPLHVPASQSKAPEMADGTYPFVVVRVGEKMLENDLFGNNHKATIGCQFPDVIDDETEDFLVLDAMCNFVISEKSTLTKWLTALGVDVDLDNGVDLEAAVGREGLAEIGHKDGKGWPRVNNISKPLATGRPHPITANSLPQSVINSDGSCNFAVFWAEAKKLGFPTKAAVVAARGPGVTPITDLDGPDAQEVLDFLAGLKVDPDDLPFGFDS